MFICYFCSVTQCVTCILQDSAENFHHSNRGQDVRISGTDDMVELERTRNAFTILGKLKNIYLFLQNNIHFLQNLWFTLAGVQPDQQMGIFRILAAILYLGNINIQASGQGGDRSYFDEQAPFAIILHISELHLMSV